MVAGIFLHPQSFTLDLTLFTPNLISFTVGDLFKEFESNDNATDDVRCFQRQFIIVPVNAGYCIGNEMIFITNATGLQSRAFLKPQQQTTLVADTVVTTTPERAIDTGQHRLPMNQQASTSATAALMHLPVNQIEWFKQCLCKAT
uniref:Nuclear transport factor 2 domain-containing protein n=1 Tax=Glossina brevipalpis TaxID=37001 RepID=A0A1A9W7U3_9MUSC